MSKTLNPDIEEIELHLRLTASLIGTVLEAYLSAHHAGVWNEEVQAALINYPKAYELCWNYEYLSDDFVIIADRITEAIDAFTRASSDQRKAKATTDMNFEGGNFCG